jgi:hypothetical protein
MTLPGRITTHNILLNDDAKKGTRRGGERAIGKETIGKRM